MLLCLGEPPGRFLLVVVHSFLFFVLLLFSTLLLFFISFLFFICCCCCSSFTVFQRHASYIRGLSPGFLHPILSFQPSPSKSDSRHFHFQPFWDLLPQFYRKRYGFEWGFFYPQAFFTFCSFTDIFDSTCIYQGLLGSWQFFLEACRASY